MPNTEILNRADHLLDAVEKLTRKVERSRRTIIVLIVAIVVNVVALVGTGYALSKVSHTSHEVAIVNDQAARNLCQSRNEASARAKKLWDDILATVFVLPPTAPPEQRTRVETTVGRLHVLVDGTYIQRDCTVPLEELNR